MEQLEKYFQLTALQRQQFAAMGELYRHWNAQINVISRKDIDNLYLHHILHSLSIAKAGLIVAGEQLLDVGCGGGFPGLPLAVLMPEVHITMVDSIGKKITVVSEVAKSLGISNIEAVNSRVESMNGTFDWVISRAVTDLRSFVQLTWDKTTRGILYLKGGDLEQEIRSANRQTQLFELDKWFDEEFFQTKKLVYLKKK